PVAPHLAAQEPPAAKRTQKLTDEQQKALLAERDAHEKRALELDKKGQPAEAIAAAEKMLAIERRVFGDVHAEVAGALEWIAERRERREEFDAAERMRGEVLTIRETLLGKAHWQVTDARLALENVTAQRKLTPQQRAQLTLVVKKNAEVVRLYGA